MEHFLKIASRGKPNTGASGGECRARKLAIAIIKNAPGLDEEAIEGACQFLRGAAIRPDAASRLIDYRGNN